jgi:diacylglycerol O-acyltransferase / wax synthase
MENAYNPMMITVLVRFNGRIDYPHLKVVMQELIKRFRRFRQRIVIPTGPFQRAYWEDDPSLDVENHIERAELSSPTSDTALQELVNLKMNSTLDFNHPLWKMTLVDNHPEGSIIIVRVHHCIADGISLMHVLLQMTKITPGGTDIELPADAVGVVNGLNGQEDDVTPTMVQAVDQVDPKSDKSQHEKGRVYRHPSFFDMLAATVRIVARRPDPQTVLKGPLSPTKKAVWSEPYSVPEIKKIARSRGATINDTLMAVASGAARRYMEYRKDDRKHNVRAFILVNLRGRAIDDELGNNFGLVFLTMPIEQSQSLDRLDQIKQGMDFLKSSAEYAASYLILMILGQLPKWIEDLAIRFLDTKGTVVATNVPGSRHELHLAGAPIQSLIAWVPQSGRIGVGLSFVSYNDQLIVGLNADAGLIPDPDVFMRLFTEEYESLQAAVAEIDP